MLPCKGAFAHRKGGRLPGAVSVGWRMTGDSISMLDSFSSVLQFAPSRDQSTCSVRVYPTFEFAYRDEPPTTPSDYPQLMGDMLVEEVDADPERCCRLSLRQRKPSHGI